MNSPLQQSILTMIGMFNKYPRTKGANKAKMNNTELQNLFQTELGGLPKEAKNPRAVDIMKGLDMNNDGEVDFSEFCILVAEKTAESETPCDKSDLQKAMKAIRDVFYEYSGREGDKEKLNKAELKSLLEKELPDLIKYNKDPQAINTLMTDLDANMVGVVGLEEFLINLAGVLVDKKK